MLFVSLSLGFGDSRIVGEMELETRELPRSWFTQVPSVLGYTWIQHRFSIAALVASMAALVPGTGLLYMMSRRVAVFVLSCGCSLLSAWAYVETFGRRLNVVGRLQHACLRPQLNHIFASLPSVQAIALPERDQPVYLPALSHTNNIRLHTITM